MSLWLGALSDLEASDLLRAEADENTQRKPFTPTEAEAIASAIEAALRPVAAARRAAAIKDRDEKGRALSTSADSAEVERQPETRDIAAQAVGYGRDTISKVRKVKDLAEDEETPEPVREAARWALGEMDATGSVAGPHHRVMCAAERTHGVWFKKKRPWRAFAYAAEVRGGCLWGSPPHRPP